MSPRLTGPLAPFYHQLSNDPTFAELSAWLRPGRLPVEPFAEWAVNGPGVGAVGSHLLIRGRGWATCQHSDAIRALHAACGGRVGSEILASASAGDRADWLAMTGPPVLIWLPSYVMPKDRKALALALVGARRRAIVVTPTLDEAPPIPGMRVAVVEEQLPAHTIAALQGWASVWDGVSWG